MRRRPRVLIPLFPGTNCHREMAHAFELAGGDPRIVTIHDLVTKKVKLSDTDLLGLAGGFSYGDHFRSGAFASHDLVTTLLDELLLVREKRIPILGICNGFQILVEAGLLPGNGEIGKPTAVLDRNASAKFVHMAEVRLYFRQPKEDIHCVWLSGLNGANFTLPVAHGEGRLVPEADEAYNVVATYGTRMGNVSMSPNGSRIAGICSSDCDGLIMGMMPHPERRVSSLRGGDQGLSIFRSGVRAVR